MIDDEITEMNREFFDAGLSMVRRAMKLVEKIENATEELQQIILHEGARETSADLNEAVDEFTSSILMSTDELYEQLEEDREWLKACRKNGDYVEKQS